MVLYFAVINSSKKIQMNRICYQENKIHNVKVKIYLGNLSFIALCYIVFYSFRNGCNLLDFIFVYFLAKIKKLRYIKLQSIIT